MMKFAFQQLKDFCEQVFLKMGCPPADAAIAAEVLVSADLRGVDSHGVARLSGYVRLWEANRINTRPDIKVVHETTSTAVVDGDLGLGLVVAPFAMEVAIEKAKNAGTGWVSVRNSNHFGIAGYHAMQALAHEMVGMAMTNASPLVAPTFSTDRMLGTNPIAVAVPAGNQPALVADFATTTAANGKLEILQRKDMEAPLGWVQDKKGGPSKNPHELKDGGALLPLGSDREHGSHKGYCLGAIVDIFSAVFSGANYGPWVPPFVSFSGPFLPIRWAWALATFWVLCALMLSAPKKNLRSTWTSGLVVSGKLHRLKATKKVLIPGDPEREISAVRLKEGVPLLAPVAEDLKNLAKKFNLDF